MAQLARGDIVLVSFPFTDMSARKVRPAVIVSSNPQKSDVIVAFITSRADAPGSYDLRLDDSDPGFASTGLKQTSIFRMNKIITLDQSILQRRLGVASVTLMRQLDHKLRAAFGLTSL